MTFLMTDVESSTHLWRGVPEAARVMARQVELIAAAAARYGGARPVDQGEGDSSLWVFTSASDALAAALESQRNLATEPWPEGGRVRVRMAVHTGESQLRDDGRNYGGTAIIRCARLRALAHGGQVLVSAATQEVTAEARPPDVRLAEIDSVRLRGFDRSERVYQLCHPDLPAAFPPLRRPASAGLQAWPSALVGRAREREELTALLAETRLLTITGVGGAGKTRLAHAVAEDVQEQFADGVVWLELGSLSDEAEVQPTIATACGAQVSSAAPILDALVRALADSRVLIVLDNCEHLLAECASVVDAISKAAPGVKMLVTSREPLGVPGEVIWRIPSLALPAEGERDPERLEAFDAVRLFVARARASLSGFRLDGGTAPAVERICRRLDGLPLALELAAARVRTLSVARIADGLDDRFRLLTGGARTAVARQRTLLASVEWSHDLLDPSERALFRRVAVFASPFEIEAVEEVAADGLLDRIAILDVLARLVDKSLVQHVGERYRLLETLRHYAGERAAEAGELPGLRDRHLAWFRRHAEAWELDRKLVTFRVLDEIAAEAPDLSAALEWSLGGERPAIELLYPLGSHWNHRYLHEPMRAASRKVLSAFEEGSAAWLEALAPIAAGLFFAVELGWIPAARKALDALGDAVPPVVRSRVEFASSLGPAFFGLPEGFAGLERAVEAGRAATHREAEVMAVLVLASCLTICGEHARARPLLAWLERHVPPDARMRFLLDLAQSSVEDGDLDSARRRLEPYLEHPSSEELQVAVDAALVALATEDVALARRAVAAAERTPEAGVFATSVAWLRSVPFLLAGDLEAAWQRLESAPWGPGVSGVRYTAAEVALSRGDAERARSLLEEIEPHVAQAASHVDVVRVLVLRAHLARAEGNSQEAEERAHRGLEIAAHHDLHLLTADALEALALLAVDADDRALGGRLLGAVEAFRDRVGYRWRFPYRRAAARELRDRVEATHFEEGRGLSLTEAAELAHRGRGERRRPAFGWESLTPTELKVVELVAQGLTNREVAARLFVSLATVKTHLVHVFAKLELRTRAELAAAATSRGLREPT